MSKKRSDTLNKNKSRGATNKSSGTAPTLRSDKASAKLKDTSGPQTFKLLQNLTEIQLVKKGKGKASKVPKDSEVLCIVPDSEKNILKQIEDDDKYVITSYKEDKLHPCLQCYLPHKSKFKVTNKSNVFYICDDSCLNIYKKIMGGKAQYNLESKKVSTSSSEKPSGKFILGKNCSACEKTVTGEEYNLSWEMLEFCNDLCLGLFQKTAGSNCSYCQAMVQTSSMGKYCVRFGYNIRQFCSNSCLEEFKKGLKLCSYCQKDISGEDGFLAPIGDKAHFKEFCTKMCMEKYEAMCAGRIYPVGSRIKNCAVCRTNKLVTIEYIKGSKVTSFCSEPCYVAFKYVNNVIPEKCSMCQKCFDTDIFEKNSAYIDNVYHRFCSKSCMNIYIITNRKIVSCFWCKVKKYNFDMILKCGPEAQTLKMCSINCLNLYQANLHDGKRSHCAQCKRLSRPVYHLKMSDGTINTFCAYGCVMTFQEKNTTAQPVIVKKGAPLAEKKEFSVAEAPTIPIITSVQSLAPESEPLPPENENNDNEDKEAEPTPSSEESASPTPTDETVVKHQYIIRLSQPPSQRNIATLCKAITAIKESSCTPTTESVEIQTDNIPEETLIVPLPIPIFVPMPIWTYSAPYAVPFPFTIPLPVPVFIPATKTSSEAIMQEIEKIQIETPANPLEAELLTMAEMVAADKKDELTGSESDCDAAVAPICSPEPPISESISVENDAENVQPSVDLEGSLTANTISAFEEEPVDLEPQVADEEDYIPKVQKRTPRLFRRSGRRGRKPAKNPLIDSPPPDNDNPPEVIEKPDAHMCLKYTFGVNAWKQWVSLKNEELEKSSSHTKPFKSEILQLTADELNYSLCLFIKEVRKPNGYEYAPDTIYYLCLGIQQYLLENMRIDNIFCDSYFEKFTDCLDEIARQFSVLYNDTHYIVTRVEEEHLWESKQLGAHSPHVLLSTLMFFNTKHFNLATVEDHMQLSFSHIMKHWKRNSSQSSKGAGSRNVLLRFYPPQQSPGTGGRKKKVYEQEENEENPLRCPVKLYEFYLSKCPESVKTRNDVFYLLPERSCVPDSPVWYSTSALPKEAQEKMLHRVKMVKEINVALLSN